MLIVLREADTAMAGLDDLGRQWIDQHPEQIRAVHAIELDLTRLPENEGAVRATELGIGPARAAAGDLLIEAQPP